MSSNNNSSNGFVPNNVHNLINNNNYNDNPSSAGEPDLASYLRVFQQQQQQQLNTSELSLEPTPINQLGLLQPLSLQRTLGGQQQQPNPNLALQQSLISTLQATTAPQAIANMGTTLTSLPTMKGPVATKADRRPSSSSVFGRGMTERQQFLIFVKILLKYIDRTNNPQLRRTAKAVVAECTRRNRMGDAEYTPLQDAVERRLRVSLGEVHWARAKQCFDTYLARQNIRTVQATAIQAV